MKKLAVLLCMFILIICFASQVMGGAIDNKTNWSVEYIRTLNRNAATDAADIALYNPAGTVKLENGFYGNLSVHYINKDYTNTINGAETDSDEPSYIPGLFAVYTNDRLSFFAAFSNHGGGGKVDFAKGTQTTNKLSYAVMQAVGPGLVSGQRVDAESHYLGYTAGAAYKFNQVFSASFGVRYIEAYREANVATTVTNLGGSFTEEAGYNEKATGMAPIIGLNIAPNDQMNIGLRYDFKTPLTFKQEVYQDTLNLLAIPPIAAAFGVSNGGRVRRDLPAILGAGFSYRFTPKFRAETNVTWYFNTDANWNGKEKDVDDGYDVGIMMEYKFSDAWLATLGYMYTNTGIDAQFMTPEAPELNAHTVGGGVAWRVLKSLVVNFAAGNSFYESETFTYSPNPLVSDTVEYKKNNLFIGLGAEYKFF